MTPQDLYGRYASTIFGAPAQSYQPNFNTGMSPEQQQQIGAQTDFFTQNNPIGLPNGQQFDMGEGGLPTYEDPVDADGNPWEPTIEDPFQPVEDPFQPVEDPFQPVEDPYYPEPDPFPIDQPVDQPVEQPVEQPVGGPGLIGGPGYGDIPSEQPVVEPPAEQNPFIPPEATGPVEMPIMGDPIFNQPEQYPDPGQSPVYDLGPDGAYHRIDMPGAFMPTYDSTQFQPTATAFGGGLLGQPGITQAQRGQLPRDQFGQLQSRLDTARRLMQPGGLPRDEFGQLTQPRIRPTRGAPRR
jgi:hypothetical protein